jgi:SAM-dependent methyltransferase
MTRRTTSLPPEYFEDKYRADIDPWRFRASAYESAKYHATLGALNRQRYKLALEAGCSIGVFTALLAPRCERLVAVDASETALREAALQPLPNVQFEVASLPEQFPAGTFDLIVLSEILYYFAPADLLRVAEKCGKALQAGGEIILCHWLGETDYPLTGAQSSALFAAAVARQEPARSLLHEGCYRLERFDFAPAVDGAE